MKKKKITINPKKKDDKCFQFAAKVLLNHREIKWNPERVSNTKLFINKYNWEEIKYTTKTDDWKKIEKNYPTIALNFSEHLFFRTPPVAFSKVFWNYSYLIKL